MRIVEFKEFIQKIPFKLQSERIEVHRWLGLGLDDVVNSLPQTDQVVRVNREFLYNCNEDLRRFSIATLMWGYPTLGRGGYIKSMLQNRLDPLVIDLQQIGVNGNLTCQELNHVVSNHYGIGMSTFTKFFHFMNVSLEGQPISILDMQIIEIMKVKGFEEMDHFPEIKYGNIRHLKAYLDWFNLLQGEIGCHKDQLEIFLFWFGRHLSH